MVFYQVLLALLVNKVGDPEYKIAAQASHLLTKLGKLAPDIHTLGVFILTIKREIKLAPDIHTVRVIILTIKREIKETNTPYPFFCNNAF